jgi:hypothetical protein
MNSRSICNPPKTPFVPLFDRNVAIARTIILQQNKRIRIAHKSSIKYILELYASCDRWRRVMLVLSCRHLLVIDGFEKIYYTEYEERDGTSKRDCAVLAGWKSKGRMDAYQRAC